jgi:hypothetical protein
MAFRDKLRNSAAGTRPFELFVGDFFTRGGSGFGAAASKARTATVRPLPIGFFRERSRTL